MARPKKLTEAEKMRDVEAYTHDDKKRTNNPPVGMAQHDKAEEKIKTYQFDPHLDPTLQWAGKAEGTSFEVPTSSIHIHESIKPHSIISHVMKEYSEALEGQLVGQQSMFEAETPAERMRRRRESIEFYQHGVNWTNRMIAGDSLVIMNSLLEKEGMAGQVQMVYIDPPYGIKYGSNFQPFVDKRDVKDKKDEDLSQEPEMIKAFRDTWELGIHSYLTYLRNRLLLARELLTDSGSVFIQISDENVHHVRELCDEIFSPQNFILQIFVKKTGGAGAPSDLLAPASVGDYIIWYAKDKKSLKYHRLFENKADAKSGINNYSNIRLPDGTERSLTPAEKKDLSIVAYKTSTRQSIKLVLDTVRLAMEKEKVTAELQLHSDQGFQYASQSYFTLTTQYGITPSMSRRANPYDNAMAENFFSILKSECIRLYKPETIHDAQTLIDEYITFYNHDRIQLNSKLSPIEKRRLFA